jgi:geranylgeranyl diphosphate synthase type II
MEYITPYVKIIEEGLESISLPDTPKKLYEPIRYSLSVGGKRIRPVLTLIAAELFGASIKETLPAALCVEIFHNFTLIHDDIMDEAPLRRKQATVPAKWGRDIAILSGDVMMILAYQQLQNYTGDTLLKLLSLFNKTAIEVCEGQQMDMDFETKQDVSTEEYLTMISLKTSVLLAASLQMGAIIAQTDDKNQCAIYEFGKNLGIAFQLQDDLLDTFGNEHNFGKKIGGDILARKKTFLFLTAYQNANDNDKQKLINEYFSEKKPDIETVKEIFVKTEADKFCKKEIEKYFKKSLQALNEITVSHKNLHLLKTISQQLIHREI